MSNAKLPSVELFFDVRDSSYWFRLNGRYVQLGKSDLAMHLRTMGYGEDYVTTGNGALRQIDLPFYHAMQERIIDYAGSLAGHEVGTFRDGAGRCYLITDQARGVFDDMPKKFDEPKFFISFVEELLPEDQSQYFFYWLAIALMSLRRGDFRPGQAVVLAGPSQCGKSLLQSVITEILGGRSANPFRYMMEVTQFNQDLCQAEHWQIEDPASTTDLRTRRIFGCKLKECTVNRDFSIHKKGKDALSLPIFRRVTISVNDEPENLAVVPPMDASIEDKIFLFKCNPVKEAFAKFRGADTGALRGFEQMAGELDRKAVWLAITKELPGIRAWLFKNFRTVPKDLRDDRFGIKAWHHPDLMAELSNMAPEVRLLGLIDHICFDENNPTPWTGKAIDLEQQLKNSAFGFEYERLCRWAGACPAYLGKLAKSQRERVSQRKVHGYTQWTITTPT